MAGSVGGKRLAGVAAFVKDVEVEVAESVGFSVTVSSVVPFVGLSEAVFVEEKARVTPRMKEVIVAGYVFFGRVKIS